jgi:hypothetical protein
VGYGIGTCAGKVADDDLEIGIATIALFHPITIAGRSKYCGDL